MRNKITILKIFFIIFLIILGPLSSQNLHSTDRYNLIERKENFAYENPKSLIVDFEEYLQIYFDDYEIWLELANLYEAYGDPNKAIQILEKEEKKLIDTSSKHKFAYRNIIGYLNFFYYKFNKINGQKRLEQDLKIFPQFYKSYSLTKEEWVKIDKKLKSGLCPSDKDLEFYYPHLYINKYNGFKFEPIIVFSRMHIDFLFLGNCLDKAKIIRESLKIEAENDIKGKFYQTVYNLMLVDNIFYNNLETCDFEEGIRLINEALFDIKNSFNANYLIYEIEYKKTQLNRILQEKTKCNFRFKESG